MDKASWRRELRARDGATREESAAVARHLAGWLAARRPAGILVYLPMPGEVDVTFVVGPPHRWYVTRTPDRGPLTIHPFDSRRELHRFGYEQPVPSSPLAHPSEIQIVLTPGLAFDRTGTRLGWGKGYYDRLFDSLPDAVAVGVTLQRLVVDRALPFDARDRRMDWLATDSGVVPLGEPR